MNRIKLAWLALIGRFDPAAPKPTTDVLFYEGGKPVFYGAGEEVKG